MDKIYEQAKDKNVAATLVYGHGSDGKAYSDSEGTKQMTTSELREAFLKGCLVSYGDDVFYKPTGFMGSDTVAWLYYIDNIGDPVTRSKLVSIADPV